MKPINILINLACVCGITTMQAQMPEVLTLEQAVQFAVEQNLQVKLARVDSEIAQLNNHAGEAGFLPELNLSLNTNESSHDINLTFFSGETIERDNAKSQGISGLARVDWTLFDGMRMFATRDRLTAMEEMSKQQLRWQIEETVAEVVHAYADILVAEKMLEFHQSNMAYSHRLYRIAEDKQNKGIGTRPEVLRPGGGPAPGHAF
jgi:outer membrane protein